jgi:hypothetical protein
MDEADFIETRLRMTVEEALKAFARTSGSEKRLARERLHVALRAFGVSRRNVSR